MYKLKDRQLNRSGCLLYKKYKQRPKEVEDIILFNFRLYYNYYSYRYWLRAVSERRTVAAKRMYSRSLQDVTRSIVRIKGVGR